jgi:thiol-disulfide isomerase/thioredoxin
MASSTSCLSQTFRAPVLQGSTLSGVRVDSSFYNGKLTLLSFFYIGCLPCMKEIPVLNRLKDHFADRPVQVVAVAPHNPGQLRAWNTPENTRSYRTEPIRYEIIPECTDSADKPGFSPVCYTLSRRFGVSAYPTSVFIGPAGDLLMTVEGFPLRDNQDETLQELIRMVEEFLKKR